MTRDDRLYNPHWGFYVLGTTHKDMLECSPFGGTWFGKSEAAENHIADLSRRVWGPGRVAEDSYNMDNYERTRTEDDNHKWENNGMATVVLVGQKPEAGASASINPPDGDPDPETGEGGEGEEGPPPPNPAIDSDVNGDDRADIVTLHTSGVAHTLNSFDAADKPTPFGGGMNSALFDNSEHHVVDASDVNGDHHADLITLCFNSPIGIQNAVCVFPGQGDNSFGNGILARGQIVPGTHGPNGHEPIGVADVTGDKRGDLVTFYAPQGNFYVFPGLENGQFGDGLTGGGGQVNSALFDRSGTYFVDVADVNGDGHADIAGLSTSGTAQVFPGTPWGIHQSPMPVGPAVDPIMADGSGHEPIGVADVNEDGKADLVTLDPSGSISTYAGMQSGNQYLSSTAVTSHSSQNSSLTDEAGEDFVGLLDRTGDGNADLIKVSSEGVIYSAPGQGDLKFGSFAYFSNGNPTNRFAKAGFEQVFEKPFIRRIGCQATGCIDRPRAMESDVDSDLRSDLVTLDRAGTAHTYRGIGAVGHQTSFGGTMDPALFDGSGHYLIDVADVTGDWRSDKVTLHSNGNAYVYPGKADGGFDTGVSSFVNSMKPGPYSPEGFEPIGVADVTGDTLADLVAFKAGQGVKLYAGNANGSFSSPIVSLPGSNSARFDQTGYHFLDLVDVNGDRRADLVAAGAEDDTVRVFKGNSNGTFVLDGIAHLPLKLDEGSGHELVGLGDVNGDHRADLATLVAGTVNVYEGRASGEFATEDAGGPVPTATSFSGALNSNLFDQSGDEIVGLLDENGDRRMDVVTVRSDGSARAYHGRANFTFNPTAVVRTLSGFKSIRFNTPSGYEVATEKPGAFRAGCIAADCPWPPMRFSREGDTDGDFRADLVSTNSEGKANVFVGGRKGMFAPATGSLPGQLDSALLDGKGHYLVDLADVAKDGKPDLVTVKDEGKVLVHPGQGNRTFGAAVDTAITLPPMMNGAGQNEPIAVSDVNGDGYDDLVVFVGPGSGTLAVYKGQADGKFATTAIVTTPPFSQAGFRSALGGGVGYYFLDVIDVDGDNYDDLVALNEGVGIVTLRGQSDGEFAAPLSSGVYVETALNDGAGVEPIGLGDVDGDGRADLAYTDEANGVTLYRGQADGKFASPATSSGIGIDSNLVDGSGEELLGLLDHDGDGRADLVTLENGDLLSYKSKGDGTFQAATVAEGSIESVRGKPSGHEFVLERPLVKRAGCSADIGCRLQTRPAVESDVDGDGRADVVSLHSSGSPVVYRTNHYAEPPVLSAVQIDPALRDQKGEYAIDTADVDGDRRADLVTIDDDGDAAVYRGQANRTFGAKIEAKADLPPVFSGGANQPIAAADVTGDRRADLIALNGSGQLATYAGQSDGTFASSAVTSLSSLNSALTDKSGAYFLDAADVNGDGRADVLALSTAGALTVYKGIADGKFEAATVTTGVTVNPSLDDGSGLEPVGLGDIDGDRRADLIVLDPATRAPKAYRGQADGKFTAAVSSTSDVDSNLFDGSGGEGLGPFDYNGDGLADLGVLRQNGTFRYHLGKVNGTVDSEVGGTVKGPLRSTRGKAIGHQLANQMPPRRRFGCAPAGCAWPPPAPVRSSAVNPDFPYGDTDPGHWRAATTELASALTPTVYLFSASPIKIEKSAMAPPYTPPYSGTTTLNCAMPEGGGFLYGAGFIDSTIEAFHPQGGGPCPITLVKETPWMDEVCVYKPSGGAPGIPWLRQDFNVHASLQYTGIPKIEVDIAGPTYGEGIDASQGSAELSKDEDVDAWRFSGATIGKGPWEQTATYETQSVGGSSAVSLHFEEGEGPCGWPELG